MRAFAAAVSLVSWVRRVTLMHAVLNLSVFKWFSQTPGMISLRLSSIKNTPVQS